MLDPFDGVAHFHSACGYFQVLIYDTYIILIFISQYLCRVAGSGGTITNADAADSICPKGWMLPTAGSQADGKSGSFQNMLSKYGLAGSVTGSADGVNS